MKAASLTQLARSLRLGIGPIRASSAALPTHIPLPSSTTGTSNASSNRNVLTLTPHASFSIPLFDASLAKPPPSARGVKVAPYDDFDFAPQSHYPGPPELPAHVEWSDRAKEIFASFEEDGYSPLPFIYHPHSFVAGGHGKERRVRYHFYAKKGTHASPTTGIPAAGHSTSAPTAPAAAAPAAATADVSAKPSRAPLPTPADYGAEGNLISLAGVVHFGPDAQGPKDCVHGGAIAALADSVMALAVAKTGMSCVTANLNINYKNLIPLDTDTVLRVAVPALSGRKVSVRFAFFSPAPPAEEPLLYSEGTALFIMPKGWESKRADANPM